MSALPMAYVPFVNSLSDAQIAKSLYADAACFRVQVQRVEKLRKVLPPNARLWVDSGFDAFPAPNPESEWADFHSSFAGYQLFSDPEFLGNPGWKDVCSYVNAVMAAAMASKPSWLSVPQLVHADGVGRNKVNRLLAKAYRQWADKAGYQGVTVLPAVFSNQRQLVNKVPRDKKLAIVRKCYLAAGATGVWAVDHTLQDQLGTSNFDTERFPGIIKLHEGLGKLPNLHVHLGGPYWGLNLVLWAKGIITNPAIALGTGYTYYPAGGYSKPPAKRVALSPLRRWTVDTADFRAWLATVISMLSPSTSAHSELAALQKELPKLSVSADGHKEQVARFYRAWFMQFAKLSPNGRSIALYQDLSNAYMLGQSLPDIPSEVGGAKKPSAVARQLMLCTL